MANVFEQFNQAPVPQQQNGDGGAGTSTNTPSNNQSDNVFAQFSNPQPKPTPQQQKLQQQAASQSTFMDSVEAFNRQFGRMAEGGLQLFGKAMSAIGAPIGDTLQAKVKQEHNQQEASLKEAEQRSPIATTVGSVLGGIGSATNMAAFTGGGLLTPTGSIAGNMGKAATLSGLTSGSEYADSEGERFDKAAHSAVAGGLTQGLIQGGSKVVGKLFNRPVQEAADEISDGLRPTLGQATGNETIQKAESGLSKVPFAGTKRGINKSAENLQSQTNQVFNDLGVDPKTPSSGIAIELKKGFTDHYDDITQKTDAAYGEALNIAKDSKLKIPLVNTSTLAKGALDDLGSLAKEGITSADLTKTPAGKLVTDIAKTGEVSASNFETLRKFISGSIEDLKKSPEGGNLLPVMQKIKSGLDLDLDSVAKKEGGGFGEAIQKARGMYKDLKAPYKNDPALKQVIKGNITSDQLLDRAVKNEQPELTKKLFNHLTPNGQKAFATGIIDKAIKNSIDNASDQFNLRTFSKQLGKMGETINAMPDTYSKPIIGLKKLLSRGEYILKANNQQSSTNIGAVIGGGGALAYQFGGLPQFFAAMGGLKAVSFMLTSPNITKALVKIAGGKITPKATDSTIKSILNNVVEKLGNSEAASVIGRAVPAGIGVSRGD